MSDTSNEDARAADVARDGDAPLKRRRSGPPASAEGEPSAPAPTTPEGERIAKAIARAGIASRRDAEAMIEAGRVTLNGSVLASPAINVTEADRITIDGEPLPARERTRLWILHKPRGVVTTARDPEGRQTVFDVLPEDLPRVVAIGRLDINTEGLLLLTNDGGLAKVVAHPETGWLRRYRVRAFGEISQPELDKLKKGVTIEGMEYGPIEASLDRVQGDNLWLTLGLREGKNREVKRILEYLGLSVNRLIRLSFGPFQLGDLEVGLVEEIRTKVLKEQLGKTLAEQAGVDFESPVREPIAPFGSSKKVVAPTRPTPQRGSPTRPPSRGERPSMRGDMRGERPGRDPARPPASARVPTGGTGPGPRRSTWHAEDAGARTGGRAPRRGGDPKAAQAAAAERGRERVGAIQSGERRVLVERLSPSPEVPPPEPHRRVKFRTREDTDAGRPPRRDAREAGGEAPRQRGRFEDRGGPERRGPPRDRAEREERGGGSDRPVRKGQAVPRGERPDHEARGERSDRPFRKGGPPPARGERPSHGPRGDRPGGQRPGGGRGFKPAGERGGFKGGKPGGKPGGRPGGRPGGGKPGTRPPRAGR